MDSKDYIKNVAALDDHRLYVQLYSGSSLTVDFTGMMETIRFSRLKDEKMFRDVRTDGVLVIWGGDVASITARELMDAALIGT